MFKRYALFRREGLYYLVVLAFILGGAMLREVNPLLMLGGMMVGALLVSWRWGASSLKRLDVKHRLPKTLTAGTPARIGIEVTNRRRWFSSWAVWAGDRIERIKADGSVDPIHSARAEAFVARVGPRSAIEGVYRCLLTRRGRYRFGPVKLSTSFPLGFLSCHRRIDESVVAVVHPRLGQMSKDWLTLLESEGDSRIRSRQGRSGFNDGDFYAIRDWRSGDSQRWIHWRTTARVNHLAVRMFERQQSRDYVLLVDLHHAAEPSHAEVDRVEDAVGFAATLVSELCRSATGKLAVVIAGLTNELIHGTAGAPLLGRILDQLAAVEGSDQVALSEAARMARAETGSGAPMIVISTRPEHTLPAWIEDESPDDVPEQTAPVTPVVSTVTGTLVVSVGGELYQRCYQSPG